MDEEVVTDPYTKAFTKENKSQVLIPEYDWEDDRYPAYAYKDVIAYSLHVRGFTQDSYSKVAHRGTFIHFCKEKESQITGDMDLGISLHRRTAILLYLTVCVR